MEGWQKVRMEEACNIVNGGTPKTGVNDFWDGSHCWITPAEMGKRSNPYINSTERTITEAGLKNSSARMLPPYSVILSSRAPIGHLVINTVPMATNQGCKGLVPKEKLDHKFLYFYLLSIVDHLNALGTGATFKELSAGKLREVTMPLPSLPEQRQIVEILDEAFAAIDQAHANAERNKANARELFDNYLNAIFTNPGPAWTTISITDACDSIIDCVNKTAPTVENPTPYKMIRTSNIKNGQISLAGC